MTTLYQQHVKYWKHCRCCCLCEGRRQTVFARGQLPCDVLFVGEAPGESEDTLGRPFVGPAGKLLDSIIAKALPEPTTYAFANLVCCIPRSTEGNGKLEEPPDDSVRACTPRLREFVKIADPKLIVCVGACARDWLDPKRKGHIEFHRTIPTIDIVHPAAILRANIAQRGLAVQRCIVTLANSL